MTPEQIWSQYGGEITARTGATKLSDTQINLQLPDGTIVPAGVNPGQAATLQLGGGGVFDRGTPEGAAKAAQFPVDPRYASPEATRAAFGVIPTNAGVTTPAIQANPPQAPSAPAPSPIGPYTVASGDTLNKIAAKNGLTLDQLLTANPQFKTAGRSADLIYVGEKVNIPGKAGTTPAQGTPPPGTPPNPPGSPANLSTGSGASNITSYMKDLMTTVNSMLGIDTEKLGIETTQKQIQDFFLQKKTGTAILEEEMKRFGVEETMSLRKELSKTILEQTQRLRKMPEDIRNTLADVGVSQTQLDRIVTAQTQKPAEILRDLLEQRGALTEDINESMAFVKLFAETRMEDEAAQLEAFKWDLEFKQGKLKDLEDDKKTILNMAIDDRKTLMGYVLEAMQNVAPKDVIDKALQSGDSATALSILGRFATDEKLETSYQDINGNRVLIVTNSKGKIVSSTVLGASGTNDSKPLSGLELGYFAESDLLVGPKLQAGMTMKDVQRISTEVHKPREWTESELKTQFEQFKVNKVPESTAITQMYAESAFVDKNLALKVLKQVYGTYTGEEEKIEEAKNYWLGDSGDTGLSGVKATPGTQKNLTPNIGPINFETLRGDNIYFPSAYTQLGDY